MNGDDDPHKTYFLTMSQLSLPHQCALEIFSGFLGGIAEITNHVGGRTVEERREPAGGYNIWNSSFEKLVDALVSSGLVVDRDEARVIVIPPFASRGLLPKGREI